MGCSQSKSAAAVVVVEPPTATTKIAVAPSASQKQVEEQSLIQAVTTAASPEVVKVAVLPKEEDPKCNHETTAIVDASEKENVTLTLAENKEGEASNDAATTTTTPVVVTSEAAKENINVSSDEVPKATTATTSSNSEKEEENGGSSGVPVDDNDDKAVVVDARPTGEISPVKAASNAVETSQESTDSVIREEIAVVAATAAEVATPAAETGSTTKKNNITETTPQETFKTEASIQNEPVNHSHQPVVVEETKISDEMIVQAAQPPELVANEKQTENSCLPEAKTSVQVDNHELPVAAVTEDVDVQKEEEVDSSDQTIIIEVVAEEQEAQDSPESGVATTSNGVAPIENHETSSTDIVVEARRHRPNPDTLLLVHHDASSSIITKDDENETTKPDSCEVIITTESANVNDEEEAVATAPFVETDSTQESSSYPPAVITESVEVKDETKVPLVETATAPGAPDANKIHRVEELQPHSDQKTSAVNDAEKIGCPLLEKKVEVTETIVGDDCPVLCAVTETEKSKPYVDEETSTINTEDKPEHIPGECVGVEEEILMPGEHDDRDVPIATHTTEEASTFGKLETSSVQVIDNSEPCVDGVEKEELISSQPEQTPVASSQTSDKGIEVEKPAPTSGVGEAPVEKVDILEDSDNKLIGSEIDYPDTDTIFCPEECPKGSAPMDMKKAAVELGNLAIEEQAVSQPTSKEGFVVDAKTLSSPNQASIEIPPNSSVAATADTTKVIADESSDITTVGKTKTGEESKNLGVSEDLEYSESHVSLSGSQEASSSSDDKEPTEKDEVGEEEPEDDEPILELKNVTAMTRVLIPEDQRQQSAPIVARWGWSTGLGKTTGTNMTGIGSDSLVVTSKSPEKASNEKGGTASKTAWGLQTVGLLSFSKSTFEANENGQAKSDELTKDAEVVSKQPMEAKDEPALSDETKQPELLSSTAAAPAVGSAAAADAPAAATTSSLEQTKKNDPPPPSPKKKQLTDIEKARLFAASILLESEHVVVKEKGKEVTPKRFGSWF